MKRIKGLGYPNNGQKSLQIALLLIPHFKPNYFETIEILDILFNLLRVCSAVIIISLIVYEVIKRNYIIKSQSIILSVLVLYFTGLFISTIWNGVNVRIIILRAVSQISVCLICMYYSRFNTSNLISALFGIGELLVYINIFTIIFFPNGLYSINGALRTYWLLGHKNQFFPFYIGFTTTLFIYTKLFNRHIRPFALYVTMLASVIIVNSATSLTALALFPLLIFLAYKGSGRIINAASLTFINIVAYILIVLVRITYIFSLFILRVLHKDPSLTGRTMIWDDLYYLLIKKPLLGYGCRTGNEVAQMLGRNVAVHAHNTLLHCLFEGGIICLLLFLLLNGFVVYYLYMFRKYYAAQILSIGMFIMNLAMIAEVYNHATLFVFYGLASSVRYLCTYMDEFELNKEERGRSKIRLRWGKN